MRKPNIEILYGGPVEFASERAFLDRLVADLEAAGHDALILANFYVKLRQVDFLVVTQRAVHIEHKNLTAPVTGGLNGPWTLNLAGGRQLEVNPNPYGQALGAKFAISDSMAEWVRKRKEAPAPRDGKFVRLLESVVCVDPELLPGSQINIDFKVKCAGYADMLKLILSPPREQQSWTSEHWRKFAVSLGLSRRDGSRATTPNGHRAAALLTGYLTRFAELRGADLHELVPLSFHSANNFLRSSDLIAGSLGGQSYQIIGPSGAGKSHLGLHCALASLEAGLVPIFIRASSYTGDLSALLRTAVAALHPGPGEDIISAAVLLRRRLLLVVDGWQECPPRLQPQLLEAVCSVAMSSGNASVLVTSQVPAPFPSSFNVEKVKTAALTSEERAALLASFAAAPAAAAIDFETPFEIEIAAECASELPWRAPRSELLDLFIRRRLAAVGAGSARPTLRAIAEAMRESLTTALPIGEATRLADRDAGASAEDLDRAVRAHVLVADQIQVRFAHELIGHVLAAEAIYLRWRGTDSMLRELRRPRNHELWDLVLPMATDPGQRIHLFKGLADPTLLHSALRGDLGQACRQAVRTEAESLLGEATFATDELRLERDEQRERLHWGGIRFVQPQVWTDFEHALLTAIGRSLPEDASWGPAILRLLEATDSACRARLEDGEWRKRATSCVAALYALFRSSDEAAAAAGLVVHAVESGLSAYSSPSRALLAAQLLEGADENAYGRLYLASLLLRWSSPHGSDLLPRLLELAWRTHAYHLRLAALWAVQGHASSAGDSVRQQLEELIHNFETKDLGLSSTIVEVLVAYGFARPDLTAETVADDIERILAHPEDAEAQGFAYSIVARQFEEVIGEQHSEAIEALSPEQREVLYTMAALGAPDYAMAGDFVLAQLLKSPSLVSLPAFLHRANRIGVPNFPNDTVQTYLLAVRGCAQLLDEPPRLNSCNTEDEAAWQAMAEVVFWANKPGIESAQREQRAAAAWKLLLETSPYAGAGVLADFLRWGDMDPRTKFASLLAVFEAFPSQVRHLAEYGLIHADRLTSYFSFSRPSERAAEFIGLLSRVGDARSASIIEGYSEDPVIGVAAVDAVHKLRAGT